ncbi:MAG: hypothetical protein WKF78_15495 [Candidatus Limnocylindrales bacterium]
MSTPRGIGVLVPPAGVDERLLEQVEVADGEAEALSERLCGAHLGPTGRSS